MGRLKGKVAMITGGASGIGRAHAQLFAKEGAKVVITTRRKVAEGTALAESIKKEGGEATFIKLDVTKESEWREVINEVIREYGKLNILVNNAGVSLAKTIEDTSLDEWNLVMDINSTGVFLGTKYAIETMKNNGELCSIINISSIDAMVGEAELPAYCASKGAVRSLTKSVALSCAQAGYNIRVNSVHPGYIHTELTEKEAQDSGLTPEQYFEKVGKMHPIGRIGEPIDIAYISLYLASDESRWVTGGEFVADGGYIAR
ncbi:MAG: glucose 1-dehydrogenase [Dehalococcoidia bacterium]|nr:MAG: glucose 1-dehydrogenase [Dehalococcoidia bacterium]